MVVVMSGRGRRNRMDGRSRTREVVIVSRLCVDVEIKFGDRYFVSAAANRVFGASVIVELLDVVFFVHKFEVFGWLDGAGV